MNPSDEEQGLEEEYLRASGEEAGRPPAAVRKAILAEAAAAARRRTPAANDSRYLWRGVAGVAVLGFAILMWQQVDHRLPGDAPVVAATRSSEVLLEATPPAAPAPAPASASAPGAAKSESAEELKAPRTAAVAAERAAVPPAVADAASDIAEPMQARAAEMESAARSSTADAMANATQAAPSAAFPPPPAAAPAAPPAAERQRSEPARALGKMSAAQDATVDANALLRLHFPQQYQSATPHSLWLVQDASGAVLRSGELAPGQTFGEIRPTIERELGSLLRPWRIRSLVNARGQAIELGIAQTP